MTTKLRHAPSILKLIVLLTLALTFHASATVDDYIARYVFEDCADLGYDLTGHYPLDQVEGNPLCENGYPAGCYCVRLDGIDDVLYRDATGDLLFANQSLTFSCWIQLQDNANTGRMFVAAGKHPSQSGTYNIGLQKLRSGDAEGRIHMYIDQSGPNSVGALSNATGAELPLLEWIHCAGVIDYAAGTVSLYIDGVLQETVGGLFDYDISAGPGTPELRIGNFWDGLWHNDVIDDVRVYDRALSAAEVWAVYNDDPCPIIETEASSWSQIKVLYR